MAPHATVPPAVFARIDHAGQPLTVVKLQEAYTGDNSQLGPQLAAALGLSADALLLVLPTEGQPLIGQGRAEQVYNEYLSTNTAAVAEQTWQPLPG
ncbi:hypothetical protein B0919_10205 [Hymenobacter sp. CRA2]|nr:hypothetical protein B0919_10205 [Hymenobacter sp. CRA2]